MNGVEGVSIATSSIVYLETTRRNKIMGKLHPNRRMVATDEKSQANLRNLYNREKEMKSKLSEKDFGIWAVGFHDAMRIIHGLPNNIFGFAEDIETGEISMIGFDLKPGNHYSIELDEEGQPCIPIDVPYFIEREEEQDNGNKD